MKVVAPLKNNEKKIPHSHPQHLLIGWTEVVAPLEKEKNLLSSMTFGQFA